MAVVVVEVGAAEGQELVARGQRGCVVGVTGKVITTKQLS